MGGIQQGRYRIAGDLLINGRSTPWYDFNVDINAYSFASMITAHGPIYPLDGYIEPLSPAAGPDYGLLGQAGLVKIGVRLGILASSFTQEPVQLVDLESGYVDETTDRYDANEIEFVARSTASVFQDSLIASAPSQYKNVRGDQLATMLFAQHGIPLTIGATSPAQFIGKAYTNDEYIKSYHARSQWDEMTDAALQDGFVLWIHNGRGYYGPPAVNLARYDLNWGQDLVSCSVNHAPRRSHNISVRVDSYAKDTEAKVTAVYGGTGANQTEEFRFFVSGLDRAKARAKAKAIWTDLVGHEFIAKLTLRPDSDFLKFIGENGANWVFQLGGVRSSAAQLYHCRQVTFKVEAGTTDEPSVVVDIVGANHAPQQGAGAYQ